MKFPKIIHLIYIPWDKNQKLKHDYMDFDASFYHSFCKQLNSEWKVILWTRDRIENFMNKYYFDEWNYVKNKSSRPVMWVDYLRWKLVYHFGGVYWQYGSKLKCSIDYFIPKYKGGIQLFTENRTNFLYRYYTSYYRIRNGTAEESLRIATQVFSSYPKNKFIDIVVDRILFNLGKYKVKEDYDILFISGNAMISTVYNECNNSGLTEKYNVDLYSLSKTKSLISFSGTGSWRLDKWTYYLPTIIVVSIFLLFVSLILF